MHNKHTIDGFLSRGWGKANILGGGGANIKGGDTDFRLFVRGGGVLLFVSLYETNMVSSTEVKLCELVDFDIKDPLALNIWMNFKKFC